MAAEAASEYPMPAMLLIETFQAAPLAANVHWKANLRRLARHRAATGAANVARGTRGTAASRRRGWGRASGLLPRCRRVLRPLPPQCRYPLPSPPGDGWRLISTSLSSDSAGIVTARTFFVSTQRAIDSSRQCKVSAQSRPKPRVGEIGWRICTAMPMTGGLDIVFAWASWTFYVAISKRASPRALIRLSISASSVMKGGAS